VTALEITRRPVVLAASASASMLTDILARIATIRGRAALYGVENDVTRSELIMGGSVEADFQQGYYAAGFVSAADPEILPGWSYDRAGIATARRADLLTVDTFAADEPRINDRGLLVEGSATNLVPYSENDPGWAGGGSGAPTVDTDHIEDGARGVSMTWTAGPVGFGDTEAHGGGFVAPNGACTLSYYLKFSRPLTGAEEITVFCTGAQGGWALAFNAGDCPTTFARRAATTTAAGTPALSVYAFVSGALTAPLTLYLARRQFEAGANASSYIPTAGSAATRAADDVSFDFASVGEGGLFIEVDLPSFDPPGGVTQTLVNWTAADNHGVRLYRDGSSLVFNVAFAGVVVYAPSVAGYSGAARVRACIGWRDGAVHAALDGVALASGVWPALALAKIRPGAAFYGSDQLRSHIRRLTVFDRMPTAEEQIAMTEGG